MWHLVGSKIPRQSSSGLQAEDSHQLANRAYTNHLTRLESYARLKTIHSSTHKALDWDSQLPLRRIASSVRVCTYVHIHETEFQSGVWSAAQYPRFCRYLEITGAGRFDLAMSWRPRTASLGWKKPVKDAESP